MGCDEDVCKTHVSYDQPYPIALLPTRTTSIQDILNNIKCDDILNDFNNPAT